MHAGWQACPEAHASGADGIRIAEAKQSNDERRHVHRINDGVVVDIGAATARGDVRPGKQAIDKWPDVVAVDAVVVVYVTAASRARRRGEDGVVVDGLIDVAGHKNRKRINVVG